ncbi:HTH-type transcriptional regulator PrtR [Trinickia soli]|nr:HTH-type transcriptional regulator PrtR [Trinickia soli]
MQVFNLLTMTTLAERLQVALDQAKMKQIELARRVGITRGAVSLWLKGATTKVEGENLVKAAQVLGVSPNWLATGRGRMKSASPREIALEDNPEYPAIRRVKIKISAGVTGFGVEPLADDHAPIVFHRSWYESNGYSPESLIAIKVNGASMEPGLYDGDWVVVNTDDTQPRDGIAFAVNYDGEVVVKRLFRTDGQWVAASDNPDKRIYRDRPMNGDTFIIGRIVHKQSERI